MNTFQAGQAVNRVLELGKKQKEINAAIGTQSTPPQSLLDEYSSVVGESNSLVRELSAEHGKKFRWNKEYKDFDVLHGNTIIRYANE